jgi:hypothetical protein
MRSSGQCVSAEGDSTRKAEGGPIQVRKPTEFKCAFKCALDTVGGLNAHSEATGY